MPPKDAKDDARPAEEEASAPAVDAPPAEPPFTVTVTVKVSDAISPRAAILGLKGGTTSCHASLVSGFDDDQRMRRYEESSVEGERSASRVSVISPLKCYTRCLGVC
jgi:hypothetical protein